MELTDYPVAVDTYLRHNFCKLVYDDIYVMGRVYVRMSRSRTYQLHPSVMELMRMCKITKLHARQLEFRINAECRWVTSGFFSVNGVAVANINLCTCADCGVLVDHINCWGILAVHGYLPICDDCYSEKCFRVGIPDTNFLDWIEFMKEQSAYIESKFYTNCNPDSGDYGKVMFLINEFPRGDRCIIISFEEFVETLHEWIQLTPDVYHQYNIPLIMQENDSEITNNYLSRANEFLTSQEGLISNDLKNFGRIATNRERIERFLIDHKSGYTYIYDEMLMLEHYRWSESVSFTHFFISQYTV